MWRDRTRYRKRLAYLNAQEESAKKIQNCFRNKQAKKNRHSLSTQKVPFRTISNTFWNFLVSRRSIESDIDIHSKLFTTLNRYWHGLQWRNRYCTRIFFLKYTILLFLQAITLILENEQLKRDVLEKIRRHKQYEADLEAMDIKIGLLVKNKTTLEVRQETVN